MSELEIRPFNNPSNDQIFNAIRNNSSTDYQRRVPAADKADQTETINALLNWKPGLNEFMYSLVNLIGLQIFKNTIWTNPLAKFKRGMLMTGDTIEEIMNGLLEAHRYDAGAEYLEADIFGTERPETQVNFHKLNRQDFYKLSINTVVLRRAFQSPQGLAEFITNLMSTPQTSDQWDEFLITSNLFRKWYDDGGFFNINVADVGNIQPDTDGTDAKYMLRQLRAMGNKLPFLSTLYNPAHMPVFAKAEELELIISSEADAAIDVDALAGAFNIDKANFAARKTIIPAEHINIPGFQAILTTRDYFVIADTALETESAINPAGLTTNFFLHHHGVYSVSRFAPAILFSTNPQTPIVLQDYVPTSIAVPTLTDANGEAATELIRGNTYQVHAALTTSPAGGDNDAVVFTITGEESTRTAIWNTGLFTVAVDDSATTITVNVSDAETGAITNTATFNVVGDLAILWPKPELELDTNDNGLYEVTPTDLVAVDHVVTIPTVTGVQYKQAGTNVANGSVITLTGSTVFTAVARSGYELAAGADATWTLS